MDRLIHCQNMALSSRESMCGDCCWFTNIQVTTMWRFTTLDPDVCKYAGKCKWLQVLYDEQSENVRGVSESLLVSSIHTIDNAD